jgi:hypothetical protein
LQAKDVQEDEDSVVETKESKSKERCPSTSSDTISIASSPSLDDSGSISLLVSKQFMYVVIYFRGLASLLLINTFCTISLASQVTHSGVNR